MKNKTRLSMIISLVAAMFILSMYSGVVAAQTPDDIYKQNMEKYQNTKKKLDDTRELFDKANSKLRNLNDVNSREELKIKTKDYLLSAIDHTRSHLEVLKTRVGQREDKSSIPNANAIIDAHLAELDQIKADVEAAQTNQDFVAAHKKLKDLWEKIRLETRYYVGIILNQRIDNFITTTDDVRIRMDAAITNMTAAGKNVSKLEADKASFNKLVTEAIANQARTEELYNEHSGFADDGTVINATAARDFLKQFDASQRATIKSLKQASKEVLKFVKDYRQISNGKLKIEGAATSTLSGKRR